MTINTKQDALTAIELLTDKARARNFSEGIFTLEGYRFTYDAAAHWDGVEPAPSRIQSLANYLDVTTLEAQQYAINMMAATDQLFEATEILKYDAKKEINALSDSSSLADVHVVYDKHLAIFETFMYA